MEGKKDEELARLIREWENVGGVNFYIPRQLQDMYDDEWGYVVDGDNPFYEDYMQARPALRRQPIASVRAEARQFYRTRLERYEKQTFLVGRAKEIPRDLNIEFEERKARVIDLGITWDEEANPAEELQLASLLGKPIHFKHCILKPQMEGVCSEPDDYQEESPVLTAIGTVYLVNSEQHSEEESRPEEESGADDVDSEEERESKYWDYWPEINF